jgi:hypothetical protein
MGLFDDVVRQTDVTLDAQAHQAELERMASARAATATNDRLRPLWQRAGREMAETLSKNGIRAIEYTGEKKRRPVKGWGVLGCQRLQGDPDLIDGYDGRLSSFTGWESGPIILRQDGVWIEITEKVVDRRRYQWYHWGEVSDFGTMRERIAYKTPEQAQRFKDRIHERSFARDETPLEEALAYQFSCYVHYRRAWSTTVPEELSLYTVGNYKRKFYTDFS